jgi:hypothetical protein
VLDSLRKPAALELGQQAELAGLREPHRLHAAAQRRPELHG